MENKNYHIIFCILLLIIIIMTCFFMNHNMLTEKITQLNEQIAQLEGDRDSWIEAWKDESDINRHLETRLYNKLGTLFDLKNNLFAYYYIGDYYFNTNFKSYNVRFPELPVDTVIYIENYGFYNIIDEFTVDNVIREENDNTDIEDICSIWLCIPNKELTNHK